ncbi:helix-turn-helix domain-containing protein [Paenarthrobacter aurescens]|uniref:helix-turn-helix domain-containing protein n=1 Tax=Paenarthrobacter aurescens TaxID=43663 RepID=UPI0021C006A8|nr:helix-turn-helix domain-containing protein [Paenarthrobacter aurescens]MCT9870866.1 helix-turn-helix domain-containing protein [Paenarthrobacter aurescens]
MALSIPELAKRLNVNESRARQLVQSGRIRGQRVGGRWIVEEADAAQYRPGKPAGRPLSERSAWLLMSCFWDDSPRHSLLEHLDPSPVEKHRLKERISRLQDSPDLPELLAWLANRAEKFEFSSSPSDIAELREDKRIHLSGVSHPRSGLLANSEVEAYVQRDDLRDVVKDWFLVEPYPGKRPNVILRAAERVPSELPPLVVAADLAERPGVREQQAAREILKSIHAH